MSRHRANKYKHIVGDPAVCENRVPHMCTVAANLMLTPREDADGQQTHREGQHEVLPNLHLKRL